MQHRSLVKPIMLAVTVAVPTVALAETATPGQSGQDDPSMRIEEVSILGDPDLIDAIAGSAHLLDDEFLARFEQGDVMRVLQSVPGLYVQDEDGAGLRPNIGIRGSGLDRSSRIALLEDGVLIAPAPYASPSAYYFPTQRRMSSLEVLKGPSAVSLGSRTTGGALNMLSTSIPDRRAVAVDLLAGQDGFGEGHLWYGDATENFGWLVETVQQRSDGFKELDTGSDTGFDIRDYLAKFRINTSNDSSLYQALEFKFGYNDQVSDETYLGLTQQDFDANPYRRYAASDLDQMRTTHRQQQARYTVRPDDDRWAVELTAYHNDFYRNWFKLNTVGGAGISGVLAAPQDFSAEMAWLTGQLDSPDDALALRNNNRSYYSRGLQGVASLALSTGTVDHDLQIGIRLHEDEEDRFQHEDLYAMRDSKLLMTSAGAPGSQSNRVSDSKVTAIFVEDRITAGDWTLTPGVRMERIRLTRTDFATSDPSRSDAPTRVRSNTVDVLIPGLGVTYTFDNGWRMLAGAHRGFNPPAPGSLADVEDSRNYELGARYKAADFSAETIAFYNDYRNLVGTCTASTGGSCDVGDQFDGGEATVAGLESVVSYEFAGLGSAGLSLPVRLVYTWTPTAEFDTAFVSGFDPWGEVESGDVLPYMPEHQLQLAADLVGQTWRAGINASFVDEARTVAGQGAIDSAASTDARWVLDLAGSYRLSDGFELFGRIDNVFDDAHVVSRRPAGLRPGKPRTAIFGFRYRL